jgi:hypothetical protein
LWPAQAVVCCRQVPRGVRRVCGGDGVCGQLMQVPRGKCRGARHLRDACSMPAVAASVLLHWQQQQQQQMGAAVRLAVLSKVGYKCMHNTCASACTTRLQGDPGRCDAQFIWTPFPRAAQGGRRL